MTPNNETAIVQAYTSGTKSITILARQFNLSRSSIRRVLNEAGFYTPEQLKRGKGELALSILNERGITVEQLPHVLAKANARLERAELIKVLMDLEEGTWQALLNEVVTARVAKSHNVHTSSAMLRLQEKVEKNARDSKPDEQ